MFERGLLFAISMSVALIDLALALFAAAYLGVIPRSKVEELRKKAARAPVVGEFLRAQPAPPRGPASKKGPQARGGR